MPNGASDVDVTVGRQIICSLNRNIHLGSLINSSKVTRSGFAYARDAGGIGIADANTLTDMRKKGEGEISGSECPDVQFIRLGCTSAPPR